MGIHSVETLGGNFYPKGEVISSRLRLRVDAEESHTR